ncbi:MAG: phosphopantothenoylcysteine decarboxylase [Planctomycetota bacterium]|nr:MAG: phosphopantothenoylcysteine decarboxylase [Planctomycetota bacterium]
MELIVIGLTGSISCYKILDLVSKMSQRGYTVQGVLTHGALQFIQPLSLEYLTGIPPVLPDIQQVNNPDHIGIADKTRLFLVAPATANIIGKLAHGIADDSLTTLALAIPIQVPRLLAPAMNHRMFSHPLVQQNLKILEETGWQIIPPGSGHLACGHEGEGRLAEPSQILEFIEKTLSFS